MQWATALSTQADLGSAIEDAAVAIRLGLEDEPPDLVFVFASQHYAEEYERIPAIMRAATGGGLVVGCSAGGVIGAGAEIEGRPALSVVAARLPDVEISAFHVDMQGLPDTLDSRTEWDRSLRVTTGASPHFVLLGEPFSFDAERFVRTLDVVYPTAKKIGGLASGGRVPGRNALFLGANTYRSGLVGVALSGLIVIDSVVAQGCRPIGEPMFVTSCADNVLLELDGRAPLDVLRDLYGGLPERDREIFRDSLFLGVVMHEDLDSYTHGDFLIRNLIGIDRESGALHVGARMRPGLVVQFHLRDARTSAEDIDILLERYARQCAEERPHGGLLFSCLGRGTHLYGHPGHDTSVFRRHLGDVPLGGFFCNGEIGDVQGRTYVHGYTSAFGLFRAPGLNS